MTGGIEMNRKKNVLKRLSKIISSDEGGDVVVVHPDYIGGSWTHIAIEFVNSQTFVDNPPDEYPGIYFGECDLKRSARYARCVLYHELGHVVLGSVYEIMSEFYDRNLYRGPIFDKYRDILPMEKRMKILNNIDIQEPVSKGYPFKSRSAERLAIREEIKREINHVIRLKTSQRYNISNAAMPWEIEKMIEEFEADIFAAANTSIREVLQTRRESKRRDSKSKYDKRDRNAYESMLRRMFRNQIIRKNLWIFKLKRFVYDEHWYEDLKPKMITVDLTDNSNLGKMNFENLSFKTE